MRVSRTGEGVALARGRVALGRGGGGLGRRACLAAEVEARHVLLEIVEHTLLNLHPIPTPMGCSMPTHLAGRADLDLLTTVRGALSAASSRRYPEYPGRQGYPAVPRGCCGGRRGCGAVGGWRYGIIGAKDRLQ